MQCKVRIRNRATGELREGILTNEIDTTGAVLLSAGSEILTWLDWEVIGNPTVEREGGKL